jgi:hypothetical protein
MPQKRPDDLIPVLLPRWYCEAQPHADTLGRACAAALVTEASADRGDDTYDVVDFYSGEIVRTVPVPGT